MATPNNSIFDLFASIHITLNAGDPISFAHKRRRFRIRDKLWVRIYVTKTLKGPEESQRKKRKINVKTKENDVGKSS